MFRKFTSIKNSYEKKNISYHTMLKPQIENIQYIITEKIDGANFSLIFKDGEMTTARRSGLCSSSFFRNDEALERRKSEVSAFAK